MSNSSAPNELTPESEIILLADAFLLDDLTYDQVERLDLLIREQPALRKFYVNHMQQTLLVRMWAKDNAHKHLEVPPVKAITQIAVEPVVESVKVPVIRSGLVIAISPQLAAGLIVGLLIAYFCSLAVLVTSHARKQGDKVADAGVAKETPVVASITQESECIWQGNHSAKSLLLRPLHSGDTLMLNAGLAEIKFSSGGKVTLEGPARFVIDGPMNCQLAHGKLIARVPRQAIGFTVTTPSGKVVDLGTEFGVEVEPNGFSQVHVFQGRVQMQFAATEMAPEAQTIELQAGEAMQFPGAGAEGTPVVADTARFSHQVPRTNPYVAAVKASNPIAYWRMEERHGDVMVDQMGRHHGRYESGVVFQQPGAAANTGYSLRLGTGTIQVKDADDLDLSTQGSLEGWFYIPPHDYASPERHEDYTLMVKGAGSEIAYGLHLSPRADGLHLRFWIDGSGDWGDGVAQYIGIANPPVETGRWYHVVGVWDGKDVRNARLYIDGREQSEGSEANGEWPIFNSSLPLTIGGRTAGWLDMPADARFDEVAIFNRAISGEEVRWHYKNAGTSQTEGGRTPTGS